MDSAGKSKMLHSMINKAKEGGEVRGGVAFEATMNFEGRKAHAVGEGGMTVSSSSLCPLGCRLVRR